jgi:hypothetical protein
MKSFRIDLSHIKDTCGSFVKFRLHKLKLQIHDAAAKARKHNSALAALPLKT